jgi:hypothetical protein
MTISGNTTHLTLHIVKVEPAEGPDGRQAETRNGFAGIPKGEEARSSPERIGLPEHDRRR